MCVLVIIDNRWLIDANSAAVITTRTAGKDLGKALLAAVDGYSSVSFSFNHRSAPPKTITTEYETELAAFPSPAPPSAAPMVVGMNARHHLTSSLSQNLDTHCTEFPDGFEETLQLQESSPTLTLISSKVSVGQH